MSIADKITRLETAKTNIATAITAKGGIVDGRDGFEEFADDISSIPEGATVNASYDISEGKLNTAITTLDGDLTATIPDGVVTISNRAFMENDVITKVVMPNSVLAIEDGISTDKIIGAFYSCEVLRNIIFSDNLTKIADYMCFGCKKLVSVTIPSGVVRIGNSAFADCTNLTNVNLSDSITSVGTTAFDHCGSLTSIIIPNSVTAIGLGAFDYSGLTDIYYTGTQSEWEQITIGTDAIPAGATIHYEYTPT